MAQKCQKHSGRKASPFKQSKQSNQKNKKKKDASVEAGGKLRTGGRKKIYLHFLKYYCHVIKH